MSPTSLANRVTPRQERYRHLQRIPPHRRFLAIVTKLSRRARAIVALALLILVWNLAVPSRKIRTAIKKSTIPSTPDPALKDIYFVTPHLDSPSAFIRYRDGSTQPIEVQQGRTGIKRVIVRDPGSTEDIYLPIGGRAILKNVEGMESTVEYASGSTCARISCQDIAEIAVEQDLNRGFEHLNRSKEQEQGVLRVPSPRNHTNSADVTLVTQFTLSRWSNFERLLDSWEGPISAAVYLTEPTDIDLAHDYSKASNFTSERVSWVFVKPDYSINEPSLLDRLRYPINRLRNFALGNSHTNNLFVVDVDFKPAARLYSRLSEAVKHESFASNKKAIIVPTFSPFNNETVLPSTPNELVKIAQNDPSLASYIDSIDPSKVPSRLSSFFSPSELSTSPATSSTEVCYIPDSEPLYLLARSRYPLYDERFTDQGGDKRSHALLLNALGYSFEIVDGGWGWHGERREEEGGAQWPAKQLVSHDGKAESVGAEDEERTTEERFDYDRDYVLEMERTWGKDVRNPKACRRRKDRGRRIRIARPDDQFGL